MSDFMQQALRTLPEEAPVWLAEVRQRGQDLCRNQTMPGKKTEGWKYTNLRALQKNTYTGKAESSELTDALKAQAVIPALDAIRLVFVNGYWNAALSEGLSDLPDGVTLSRFANAEKSLQTVISSTLDQQIMLEKHPFASLNSASLSDGVVFKVGRNIRMDRPVHLVYINTRQELDYSVNTRLLVVLESGAEASIIEHYAEGESDQNGFTNSVTEITLAENAHLNHYRFQLEHETALHIGQVSAALSRDATLNSFYIGFGGKLKRIDAIVQYAGEGAHCDMNGIYLTRNDQLMDYHTCVEHAVPRCTTQESFRGIVGDRSKAVFNGRIHIHPQAQKTAAQMSNKNLLTSNKAEVDTKPELEIYADDVQCAHGATVAQLDETAMHYLRTRGVSEQDARMMLSFGFINELVNQLQSKVLADFIRPQLVKMFCGDSKLLRHIG